MLKKIKCHLCGTKLFDKNEDITEGTIIIECKGCKRKLRIKFEKIKKKTEGKEVV